MGLRCLYTGARSCCELRLHLGELQAPVMACTYTWIAASITLAGVQCILHSSFLNFDSSFVFRCALLFLYFPPWYTALRSRMTLHHHSQVIFADRPWDPEGHTWNLARSPMPFVFCQSVGGGQQRKMDSWRPRRVTEIRAE
jgi:hypothetical protein